MRTTRIFSTEPLKSDDRIHLPAPAVRHVVQVLRLSAGCELALFDGSGLEYQGTIESASRTQVTVRLGTGFTSTAESTLHLSLWHGLCRGDRLDTVVQKATELGISEIQPVITERDVVRLDARRTNRKMEHWRAIAIGACEQSGRVKVPLIHPPVALTECLRRFAAERGTGVTALMCDPDGESGLRQQLNPGQDVILLTGPEGGFSNPEKLAAKNAGFSLISLGPRTLRTETAPVVILSLVQGLLGDLGI